MKQNLNLVRLVGMGIPAILAIWAWPLEGAQTTATVGAYYFEGWYHDTPGVYAAFANEELRTNFPGREPIWGGGLWRGDTVEIMEQQIDLAAQHGIAFFSFDWYWYGTPAATTNDGINSGLKHFMMASNRDLMRYNITIVDAAPTTIDSDVEWEQVAQTLLPHLTDEQYLRVAGKPLIINFNPSGMTQTNYDYFQQLATQAGLAGITFAANVAGSPSLYSHVTRYNAVPGYGAGEASLPYKNLTYYMDGIAPDPSDPWADPGFWNIDVAGMDATQRYIPTVMAGWDPRPWNTPASWYFNDPTWIVGSENWGRTPEAFAAHVQAAVDWIDDNPDLATPERLVMVYAWNEFGEGGYIAPTVGDPQGQYLDAVHATVLIPEFGIETAVELYWAQTGNTHHVEYTTDLVDGVWMDLDRPVETNGVERRVFNSIRGTPRRFYRLTPP